MKIEILANQPNASPAPARARSWGWRPLFTAALLISAFCLSGWAQYSINWHTIDGGGSTSTGGVYTVTGTVGQPDAGRMSGGSYTLQGGFWAIVAVQAPGAPVLTIVPTGMGQATLSWSADQPGWRLQETPTLTPSAWANSPSGTNNPVVVPALGPTKFYRLIKP